MSLINDALRRARQQRRQESPKPSPLPPLQAVEYRRRPSPWPLIIMLPTVFILLGLAGFFLWAFTEYRRAAATQMAATAALESQRALSAAIANTATNPVMPQQLAVPSPPAATAAPPVSEAPAVVTSAIRSATATTNAAMGASTNPPSGMETTTNTQAVAAASPPAPPPFKLQGIYYSRSRPSALINGKAVFVGETVEGARVVSIERESVTLEQRGKTNVLRVP